MKTTSKIATAQALHRLLPKIKRRAFFEILQQPQCIGAGVTYWFQRGSQTPWDKRTDEAKKAAKKAALKLIKVALKSRWVAPSDVSDAAIHDPKLTALLM
jgi:hypothetical protein